MEVVVKDVTAAASVSGAAIKLFKAEAVWNEACCIEVLMMLTTHPCLPDHLAWTWSKTRSDLDRVCDFTSMAALGVVLALALVLWTHCN